MQLLLISVHIIQRSIEMYLAAPTSKANEPVIEHILRDPGSVDIGTV